MGLYAIGDLHLHFQSELLGRGRNLIPGSKSGNKIRSKSRYKNSFNFAGFLEAGKLAMTIPDKPNSRNQKYVAVIK